MSVKSVLMSFDAHSGENPALPAGYGAISLTLLGADVTADFRAAQGVLPSACDIVRADLERRGYEVEMGVDDRELARKRGAA